MKLICATLAQSKLQTQKVNSLLAAMSRLQEIKKDVSRSNRRLTKMASHLHLFTIATIEELVVLKLMNFMNGQPTPMTLAKEMMPS